MGSADRHADEQMAAFGQGTPGLPAPTSGAGAHELATDSNDPTVLREMLERARERLAFYESFDRIIGENIRRSGELMVETVQLREQARAQAAEMAAERAAFEEARQADRAKYRNLVTDALNDVAATRPVIDQLIERLQEALVAFGEEPAAGMPATEAVEEAIEEAQPELEPAFESSPETAMAPPTAPSVTAAEEVEAAPEPEPKALEGTDTTPAGELATEPSANEGESAMEEEPAAAEPATEPSVEATEGPRTVEVLAHGVTTAAIAIALQRTLRELEHVRSVEAREFADGVLRLQVTAEAPIQQADIAEWLASHEGSVANAAAAVLEINLGDTPAT